MKVKRLSLLFGFFGLASAAWADAVDEYVKATMARDHLPGVVLAVVDPAGVVGYREYGVANRETGDKFTRSSVHRVASLSKQMCSYTALTLIRDGKLSLDDEVRKWYPNAPEHWNGVKVRHLMSHTSGIPDPEGFLYSKEYTIDEYVALIGKAPLASAPGTKYRYNNYAYGLLGDLVGKAGGDTFPAVVKSRLFDVVGMTNTSYYRADQKIEREVFGYRWNDGKFEIPLRKRPSLFHGSGGVLSTLEDMVKYELAIRAGVLDKDLLHQQWTKQFPKLGGYGFGWHVGEGEVRHTGTTFGYTSAFLREIDAGWTILLFRNCDEGSQMDMAVDVLKIWKGQTGSQSRQ